MCSLRSKWHAWHLTIVLKRPAPHPCVDRTRYGTVQHGVALVSKFVSVPYVVAGIDFLTGKSPYWTNECPIPMHFLQIAIQLWPKLLNLHLSFRNWLYWLHKNFNLAILRLYLQFDSFRLLNLLLYALFPISFCSIRSTQTWSLLHHSSVPLHKFRFFVVAAFPVANRHSFIIII